MNKNVESVVLNCFIRVIKTDGKYMLYRRGVKNKGIIGYLLRKSMRPMSSDNPFINADSSEKVADTLRDITNSMAKSNGKRGGIKDLDKYEHVTMTINHLLHFFMEPNGISMDKLCSMGEEIYGLSCNKLFGDTIEEIEKQQEVEMDKLSNLNEIKAKMFKDYVNGISSGKISHSVSFDDYFNNHIGDIANSKGIKINTDDATGHCLGMPPEEAGARRNNWFTEMMASVDEGDRAF